MNVEVISHLSLSALVLQAYFTGAGSFLPLTNDLSYKGENRSTAKLSAINLSLFILMHLLCLFLGSHWDSQFLTSLGSMFLVYAFVFSFPLFPLEGYYLWRESKVYWLIIWLVIIDLFNRNLEESLFLII